MTDNIDKLITDIIQHADMVKKTVEGNKPIMQWKSYPKMREAVEDVIDEQVEGDRWHRTIGDE